MPSGSGAPQPGCGEVWCDGYEPHQHDAHYKAYHKTWPPLRLVSVVCIRFVLDRLRYSLQPDTITQSTLAIMSATTPLGRPAAVHADVFKSLLVLSTLP